MARRAKMTMEPLKKKTRLYEDIVQQFTQKIESGELKAGDKLPTERELVDQLGVSRTSIREALRAMELLGMIESRVSEGTFVKHSGVDRTLLSLAHNGAVDEKRVAEMYEIRMLLETYSVRQAARRRTPEQLAGLRETIENMREEIALGNRGQENDKRFHKQIAEAADNGVLIGILDLFAESLNSSIHVANAHVNVNDIIGEHQRTYDAIAQQDEKTAERLMRSHIKRALDRTKFMTAKAEKK